MNYSSIIKKVLTPFIFTLLLNITLQADNNPNKEHIIFISVASQDEVFWGSIHRLAEVAAKDLDANLEIIYTNRNHIKAVTVAKKIAKRDKKPDYVIVVGEKLIASRSIPPLTNAGIKVFVYGDLNDEEKKIIGEPREKFPNYIGKIAVDDYMAGYLTAKLMIKKAIKLELRDKDGYINFVAFEGVKQTSFSSERVKGLQDAVQAYPMIRVLQIIPTDWTYEYAEKSLPKLLSRYENYKIAGVWCANSVLASASSDVLIAKGLTPNVDFVTAGTDWDKKSVQNVNMGNIVGIAGGHMAIASWIVTLIHDYHNGIDFDSSVYVNKITIMDKNLSDKFLKFFNSSDWDNIDYRRFSKKENENIKNYNFSFTNILDNISN